jgi:hypothetical protein
VLLWVSIQELEQMALVFELGSAKTTAREVNTGWA